jgi:hypothetical protein
MAKKKTTKKYQAGSAVDSVNVKNYQNTNPNARNYNVAPASTAYDKEFRDRFVKGAENYRLAQEREKKKQEKKERLKSILGLKKGGTSKSKSKKK